MKLLDTLTRAADEEQLQLQPLPIHAAAAQPEHLRRHYALLLAAVLTAQPAVSEAQSRLLRLLLDALQLGDIRGALFDQARELAPEPLLEAARVIREAGFAAHLLLDVLVLLRLDAPLDDESVRLVGELAAFLGLDSEESAIRATDAVQILGLDNSVQTAAGEAVTDMFNQANLLARYWPGKLSQKLTTEALRAGLQGGLWLLDNDLAVDFPWQASDAILLFRNGATLNTFAKEGEINLNNCQLLDAAMSFQGACRIVLQSCDWQGDYDPQARRTAIDSQGQRLTAKNCKFSTRNARTININEARLDLQNCSFTRCGNLLLDGGAIEHEGKPKQGFRDSGSEASIVDCQFDTCQGAVAGALKLSYLIEIVRCEFISCKGTLSKSRLKFLHAHTQPEAPEINEVDEDEFWNTINSNTAIFTTGTLVTNKETKTQKDEKLENISIHSRSSGGLRTIKNCTFRDSSVYATIQSDETIAENSQFAKSSICYETTSDYRIPTAKSCTFK